MSPAEPRWRGIRQRWNSLRRDAAMVWLGLTGGHPPPLIRRGPRAGGLATVDAARAWRIERVIRETEAAVSLVLSQPSGRPSGFKPGQFLTLLLPLKDGALLRRAYSISSDHLDQAQVRITCKLMAGGRGSSYLHEQVRPGDVLRALGPSGNFVVDPDPDRARHFVLIGGGSGITPLWAIAQAVLSSEPGSRISLIYGNRSERDIIFAREIRELSAAQPQRLQIHHVLSDPLDPAFPASLGVLDDDGLGGVLDGVLQQSELPPSFYLCAPLPAMAQVRQVLESRGIKAEQIRQEQFASAERPATAVATEPQPLTVNFPAGSRTATIAAGQTLLDGALRAGIPLSFSCAVGGCGACKVKLVQGEVAMSQPNCLTAAEQAAGCILACVAHPLGPVVVEPEQ